MTLASNVGNDSTDVVSLSFGASAVTTGEPFLDMTYRPDYWTNARLPADDILLSDSHVQIVYDIQGAYNRFVETSANINKQLRREFEVT